MTWVKCLLALKSLNGDDSRFSTLEAPTDWNDNILSELFSKCISSDTNVSNSLIELPPTQLHSNIESSRFPQFSNKSSNVPSHDSVYGGWTTVSEPKDTAVTETDNRGNTNESEKNILLSCTSSEEEEESFYHSAPQKNKSHDLFDVSK